MQKMIKLPKHSHFILFAIIAIIAINYIASSLFGRIDLTEDKRYTLLPTTAYTISRLTDTVRFSVYLDGDIPIAFGKMKREINDLLQECKHIGGEKIQIRFIDPSKINKDKATTTHTIKRLMEYGLKPYTIQEEDEQGKLVQSYIIPGMIASTSERYTPINFLANALGNTTEEQIHSALQQLEYEIVKSIKQLTSVGRKNIAFLTGHGESPLYKVFDATMLLTEQYNVDRITTTQLLDSIEKYEVLVISKPQTQFSESDKYIIDQYIMKGGTLYVAADYAYVPTDSLQLQSHVTAYPLDLNISDLLFNIGARVNYNILLDQQCARIPFNVSQRGMQARFEPAPWYYYPLLKPLKNNTHSITHKIDVVKANFSSTLDTVEGNGHIKKHILLASSAYSRTLNLPNTVGFSILEIVPDQHFFSSYYLPVAALFEGELHSLYKNRPSPLAPEMQARIQPTHTTTSAKIIVAADGDIFENEIEIRGLDTIPKPMHYYKYFAVDKKIYTGNKDFFLNAINYLSGDEDLLQLRSREFKIRLLNKNRIIEEKLYWQLLVTTVPNVLLIIIGIIVMQVRKRKFKTLSHGN